MGALGRPARPRAMTIMTIMTKSRYAKPRTAPWTVAEAKARFSEVVDRIFISVGTIAELRRGVQLLPEGKRRRQLDAWVVDDIPGRFASRIIDVDQAIAEAWGAMSAVAQKSARNPSAIDALLAATARVRECVLITCDRHDFEPFGIDLFDPWSESPGKPA